EFIDERRGKRADEAERTGSVRARPERRIQSAFIGAVESPGNQGSAQADAVFVAQQVVELHRVLAQVRVVRIGADPVGSPLLKTGRGEGKLVEQGTAIRADAVRGNDVVREGLLGVRVGRHTGAAEKRIGGAEQTAQVPRTYFRGRHRVSIGAVVAA